MLNVEQIENRIDKTVAGAVAVSDAVGGVMFKDMMQVMEFAKMMAVSGTAVPRHLRTNPGASLAVCVQALEWHMSPFSVANKSYEVNDRIAYEAQLIMAVINARAPLQKRLRYNYTGEGSELRCTVSGQLKGETEPLEYQSPAIKDIRPQNSPLWKTDPRQQLGYYSGRNWARRFCPEVILGIYAEDELRDSEIGPDHARDITPEKPAIKDRLKGQAGRNGFHAENAAQLPAPTNKPLADSAFVGRKKELVTVDATVTHVTAETKTTEPVVDQIHDEEKKHPEATENEREIREEFWSIKEDALNASTSLEEVNTLDTETKAIFTPYPDLSCHWRKLCDQRRAFFAQAPAATVKPTTAATSQPQPAEDFGF